MKKLLNFILFCVVAGWLSFGFATTAHADTLPPGFLVGDDTGFQAGTDGEYFIVNNNLSPGQVFHREITLSNYSMEEGSFVIKLVMNPADEEHVPETTGVINLLEAVSVKLTYQGAIIYQGTIDGNGTPVANQKQNPIDLGTLEVGEVRNIQAEFTVSNEYPAEAWKNVNAVDFYWLFFANREATPPTTEPPTSSTPPSSSELPSTGKLPQTGEDWRNVLLGMIAGFALITVALILAKRRHENQEH